MYFKCCIPNCASKREEAKLHKFPSAEDQRNKWLEFINCDNLKRMHSSNLVKMLVCHKHFEKKFHTAKSGIKMTAYPTLFSLEEIESGFSSRSNNEQENVLVDHTYTRKRHYDHTYYKIEQHSPLQKAQDPLIDLTNIPSTSFAPLSHLDNLGNVSDFTDIPSTSFAPQSHLDNLGNVSDFTDIPSTSFAPLSHLDNLGNVSDFTDIPSTSFAPQSHLDNLGNVSGNFLITFYFIFSVH
ncbi:unnamed protein product [Parnassius mnemosyne]|uniref:THAP-type domain-containing protein n=1 Tax=Parnassius mnemosyne TaxID=213953 RepID=A0AAV1KUT6_9NEOP